MKRPILYAFVSLLLNSCTNQPKSIDVELENAKWYFYAYSNELKGYTSSGDELKPLACDIKFNGIDTISADTVNFFFTLFYKDSATTCYLKPKELVGISQIKKRYFIPIYHQIVYDLETDSVVAQRMKTNSDQLKEKILLDPTLTNPWLLSAVKQR